MENFVKRMIKEHSYLVFKIKKLEDYVYGHRGEQDERHEFANKCIQLSGMRTYEKALRARLINQNICIDDDGGYYEKVAQVVDTPEEEPKKESEDNTNEDKIALE